MSDKIVVDEEKCTGCAICVDACPVDVLRVAPDRRKAYAAYASDCQTCFLCENDCPTHAIHIDQSVAGPRVLSIYDCFSVDIKPLVGNTWQEPPSD